MALGWMMLLKTVPWGDVISTAPVVADGAKKLWKAVAKKTPADAADAAEAAARTQEAPTVETQANQALAAIRLQLAALEQAAQESHAQMLESSKLITALAEQNTQLVARAEINRRRILWLYACSAALAILGIVNLALLWGR